MLRNTPVPFFFVQLVQAEAISNAEDRESPREKGACVSHCWRSDPRARPFRHGPRLSQSFATHCARQQTHSLACSRRRDPRRGAAARTRLSMSLYARARAHAPRRARAHTLPARDRAHWRAYTASLRVEHAETREDRRPSRCAACGSHSSTARPPRRSDERMRTATSLRRANESIFGSCSRAIVEGAPPRTLDQPQKSSARPRRARRYPDGGNNRMNFLTTVRRICTPH